MYPTLYHAFKDLFGVDLNFLKPVNSFGLFVAIAFLSAAFLFKKEIIRKEKEGLLSSKFIIAIEGKKAYVKELMGLFMIGFIIGFKFLYPFYDASVIDDFKHYILSWKGSIFGGIAIGLGLALHNYYQSEKTKLPEPVEVEKEVKPHEHISSITLLALVFGFLGAKFFAWLEDPVPLSEFLHDPFSGLTIYGGLIAASVACIIYIRKQKLHVFHILDAVSPALIIAYGIGRLGCHFSGDGDWGIENTAAKPNLISIFPDWIWSYDYPHNVLNQGIRIQDCLYSDYCNKLAIPVFPTPIYEFVLCLGIFGLLMYFRKKIKLTGFIFLSYLFLNGIERFTIELIRINETYNLFGFLVTQAQIISTLFILMSFIGFGVLRKKPLYFD